MDCASTATTASPTKRTTSCASARRGGEAQGLPSARFMNGLVGIGLTPAATNSAPVTTAITPGIARAAAVSIDTMRACA